MAETFTATAGSSTTIGFAQYGSTSWNTGTSNGAWSVEIRSGADILLLRQILEMLG